MRNVKVRVFKLESSMKRDREKFEYALNSFLRKAAVLKTEVCNNCLIVFYTSFENAPVFTD